MLANVENLVMKDDSEQLLRHFIIYGLEQMVLFESQRSLARLKIKHRQIVVRFSKIRFKRQRLFVACDGLLRSMSLSQCEAKVVMSRSHVRGQTDSLLQRFDRTGHLAGFEIDNPEIVISVGKIWSCTDGFLENCHRLLNTAVFGICKSQFG